MNLTKLTMLRNVFFSARMPTSILTSNVTLTDLYFYDLRFPIIEMCGNLRNFLLLRILRENDFTSVGNGSSNKIGTLVPRGGDTPPESDGGVVAP